MFNSPFQMPNPTMTPGGAYEYANSGVQYVDNASQHQGDPTKYQGNLTRDVLRYQNGQLMHGMGLGFNGIGNQLSTGFNDLADQMQYGGVYGSSQNRVYSPQSKNGYGGGWGSSNPFMIGSF